MDASPESGMEATGGMGEAVSTAMGGVLDSPRSNEGDAGACASSSSNGDVPEAPVEESNLVVTTNGTEHQPLVPIVGSPTGQAKGSGYPKCFVQVPLCCPFGMPNVDEEMLVVTPEDDFSIYADAVVCTIIFLSLFITAS